MLCILLHSILCFNAYYSIFTAYSRTEAEIQLPLKRFSDSSVFSLIRAGWCEEGHPATKNSLQHPWQDPLASHPTEDQVQGRCPGLQVHPWNSPTIPIGDAQRSCEHRWPTIPSICRAWGPRCSTVQNCQIRLPNVRCFGSHFLEHVDDWTQKFQFNWSCF